MNTHFPEDLQKQSYSSHRYAPRKETFHKQFWDLREKKPSPPKWLIHTSWTLREERWGALAQCPWLPASQCCITLFTQFYRNAQRTSQALLLLKTFPKFQQEAWLTHTVKHSQPLLPTASHPCISTRHWLKIHETTTIPNPLYWARTDIFSCLHFPNNPV